MMESKIFWKLRRLEACFSRFKLKEDNMVNFATITLNISHKLSNQTHLSFLMLQNRRPHPHLPSNPFSPYLPPLFLTIFLNLFTSFLPLNVAKSRGLLSVQWNSADLLIPTLVPSFSSCFPAKLFIFRRRRAVFPARGVVFEGRW